MLSVKGTISDEVSKYPSEVRRVRGFSEREKDDCNAMHPFYVRVMTSRVGDLERVRIDVAGHCLTVLFLQSLRSSDCSPTRDRGEWGWQMGKKNDSRLKG